MSPLLIAVLCSGNAVVSVSYAPCSYVIVVSVGLRSNGIPLPRTHMGNKAGVTGCQNLSNNPRVARNVHRVSFADAHVL